MPPVLRHTAGCPSGQRERSVKPSAQPTLVRTQHLPHPGETACSLRKRGPAGRFLLVTACISVCHRGSMHSSGYGHIADSVRAERAVRITARFADPCPFCPVIRRRTARLTGVCRVSRPAGSSPSRSRQAAGRPCSYLRPGRAGCRIGPHHLRGSAEGMTGCVAATGMEDQHGSDGERRCARIWTPRRAAASCRKGTPCPWSGAGSGGAGQVLVVDW
jgi:hypothetical protein